MLDTQTIETILQFLGRTQLVGNEVPAFVNATNKLHEERLRLQATEQKPPKPTTEKTQR